MGKKSSNVQKPTAAEEEVLVALLPDPLKEKVEAGEYSVYRGQKPEKPVVIDTNGRLVKGSGRWPGANDAAAIGRRYGYKDSGDYQTAMKILVPIDGGEDERGSFAWLVNQGFDAAEGSPQKIKCPDCGYNGLFAFKKDSNAIIKLIEMVHGKAKESQDINIKNEQLIGILQSRVSINDLSVHDITDEEIAERERFMIEGEFTRSDDNG